MTKRQIIRILMLSPLYFTLPLAERHRVVLSLCRRNAA